GFGRALSAFSTSLEYWTRSMKRQTYVMKRTGFLGSVRHGSRSLAPIILGPGEVFRFNAKSSELSFTRAPRQSARGISRFGQESQLLRISELPASELMQASFIQNM